MDRENRLFLEDILARTEAVMAQCAELKALVSKQLESDNKPADTETVSETLPEAVPEADIPAPEIPIVDFDLPEPIEIPDSVIPLFEKARKSKSDAVVDILASKQAWRTDIPGAKVSDIRSAISLNDRILFINQLFGEDPAAFKEALTSLNTMDNFDQAADFIASAHPEWDMESDTVYRFMMAVRRRLQ